MRYYLSAILFSVLLSSGCGTSRVVPRSGFAVSEHHEPDDDPRSETLRQSAPRPHPRHNERYNTDQPVNQQVKSEKNDPERRSDERPVLSFSGIQCDHVRIKGVNPLPENGLVIPLDELADDFCYPYDGKLISDYGRRGNSMHTGIDLKAIPNDTIRAAFPGVVRMSKNYSGYGNVVVISHYCGFETLYAHGSRNLVKTNDLVEAGTPIALAGRTGRATTEHLHFEMRASGEHIDPKILLDPEQRELRSGVLHIGYINGTVVAAHSEKELTDAHERAIAYETSVNEARAAALAASKSNAGKPNESAPAAEYYKVKNGDTLSHIAARYKTTVKKLTQLNGIKSTSVLRINQKLRIR